MASAFLKLWRRGKAALFSIEDLADLMDQLVETDWILLVSGSLAELYPMITHFGWHHVLRLEQTLRRDRGSVHQEFDWLQKVSGHRWLQESTDFYLR